MAVAVNRADAGNRQQGGGGRRLSCDGAQLTFELGDTDFEQPDFFDEQRHGAANERG
jgi:hypothetical protein